MIPKDDVWWALKKLGIEEWLVKIVQSMYLNVQSCVRVNAEAAIQRCSVEKVF